MVLSDVAESMADVKVRRINNLRCFDVVGNSKDEPFPSVSFADLEMAGSLHLALADVCATAHLTGAGFRRPVVIDSAFAI
jgi:hypothetical protein